MSGSGDGYPLGDSGAVSWTGKVMVAAIIVLFVAVVFVIFLHLYAKWFWRRHDNASPRRRRFVFNADGVPASTATRRGLDVAVLLSLPVVTFRSAEFEEGLECSVCLCELADGEKARLLPKCNHGFHLECIDMWFHSHSTCPLCRCMVSSDLLPESATMEMQTHAAGDWLAAETVVYPTNVLFWARLPSPSSSSSATSSSHIVIDIPRPAVDIASTDAATANVSPSCGRPVEEMKSPASRLHSLKRLLSREGRLAIPISPRGGGDVEEGEAMKASSGS